MASKYAAILDRYTNSQIINPRETASGFRGLFERGSLGAAITYGLLSYAADKSDAADRQFKAIQDLRKSELEERRTLAEISRQEALTADITTDNERADREFRVKQDLANREFEADRLERIENQKLRDFTQKSAVENQRRDDAFRTKSLDITSQSAERQDARLARQAELNAATRSQTLANSRATLDLRRDEFKSKQDLANKSFNARNNLSRKSLGLIDKISSSIDKSLTLPERERNIKRSIEEAESLLSSDTGFLNYNVTRRPEQLDRINSLKDAIRIQTQELADLKQEGSDNEALTNRNLSILKLINSIK